MSDVLNPGALTRLAKFCGMLGSIYDGERATAAAMADSLVRSAGLTWQQILAGPLLTHAPPARRESAPLTADEILDLHGGQLTFWDREFLGSIIRKRQRLSSRQAEVLEEIRTRVGAHAR